MRIYISLSRNEQNTAEVQRELHRIIPQFTEKHINDAKLAKRQSRCEEYFKEIALILNVENSNERAKNLQLEGCRAKRSSSGTYKKGTRSGQQTTKPVPEMPDKTIASEAKIEKSPESVPTDSAPSNRRVTVAVSPHSAEGNRLALFKAEQLYQQKKYDQALDAANRLKAQSPKGAWALIGLSSCHLGNADLAQQSLSFVSETDARLIVRECSENHINIKK